MEFNDSIFCCIKIIDLKQKIQYNLKKITNGGGELCYSIKNSLVRCQWDPERDVYGKPIGRRSIRLGRRGEVVVKYVN